MPETFKAAPEPRDLLPFEKAIALRGGDRLVVREFTLRQRDAIASILDELGDDDAANLIRQFLGAENAPDEQVEIAVLDVLRGVLGKVKAGSFSRLLAAALDLPENRRNWEGSNSLDWVLDHVTIADEPEILRAVLEVNDVRAYLGKLWALLPFEAKVKDETEGGA